MTSSEIERLGRSTYLSLTTFRRDGTPVATPVWLARDGDDLYAVTDPASGKAKRLRNSGRVLVAACDGRGRVSEEPVEGTAQLCDEQGTAHAVALIAGRYGLQYRAIGWAASLRRRRREQVGIRITVP